MPKIVSVNQQRWYTQFRNGDDFLSNPSDISKSFLGLAGEKVRGVFDISVEWYANATAVSPWNVQPSSIALSSGVWSGFGFEVGQVFDCYALWSSNPTFQFQGEITSIDSNGQRINFNVLQGGAPAAAIESDFAIRATSAENALYSLQFDFGLLNSSETFNNISKISGNPQTFIGDDIGLGGLRSTTPVPMSVVGNYNDWVTGSATAAYVSEDGYVQHFQVVHEFHVAAFSDNRLLFWPELLTVPPAYSAFPVRYSLRATFREFATAVSNWQGTFDDLGGNSRWYQDNNSNQPFQIDSVAYVDNDTNDPVNSLTISERTNVEIRVSKKSGSFSAGQRFGLQVFFIETDEADFQNTQTTAVENFILDLAFHTEGGAAYTNANGVIRVLASAIDGGALVITAEIEYTLAQQQKAQGGQYLLSVIIGEGAVPAFKFLRYNLIADVNGYADVNAIPFLCTFDTINFYEHNAIYPAGAKTSANLWNEDGFLIEIPFALYLAQSAFLNRLDVKLVAYNTVTNTYFELDNYSFNTAAAIVSEGVQQISISNFRNYNLGRGSQFRSAKIETLAKVGDIQNYRCLIGQKVSWQDWIRNLDADTVFFDNAEPNNNLNYKASNYSGLENYEIRIRVEATVSGVDSLNRVVDGVSETTSGDLNIFDYNEDGQVTPVWSGVVKTFDTLTNEPLGVDILATRNTLFEVEWTNSTGPVVSNTAQYAIHRIEILNDQGWQIEELSSVVQNPRFFLDSTDGSGLLTLSVESGKLVSRCLIKSENIGNSEQYKLSARIKKN